MTLPGRILLFTPVLLFSAAVPLLAQTATPTAVAPATATPPADTGQAPSSLLAPAMSQIRQTLAGLRTDKWKTPGAVTQETAQNLASIQRDLDSTLPGLLATADHNPGSVQDVLPAYRNVEALYEVLLRVTEVSKLAAPIPQSTSLQQAIATLEDARRTFGDQVQGSAVNETKAIVSLQGQLKAAQAAPAVQTVAAAAPVCTAPAATTKKRATTTKPKPKPTPAATTSTPQ